jgi:hypothetical protein
MLDLGGYELIARLQPFPIGFFPFLRKFRRSTGKLFTFVMPPAAQQRACRSFSEGLIPPLDDLLVKGNLLRMLGVVFGHLATLVASHALDACGAERGPPTSDAAFLRNPCIKMVLVPILGGPHASLEVVAFAKGWRESWNWLQSPT